MSQMRNKRYPDIFGPTPATFSHRVAHTLHTLPPHQTRRSVGWMPIAAGTLAVAAMVVVVSLRGGVFPDAVSPQATAQASAAVAQATTAASAMPQATAQATARPEASAAATQAAVGRETTMPEATPAPQSSQWNVKNGLAVAGMTLPNSDPAMQNILQLSERLDGIVLKPGQTLRFWEAVGKKARQELNTMTVFTDGAPGEGITGVDMVSTLLYQSAVCAGLTIVERHAHEQPPAYAPAGQDAKVDFGKGYDLAISNPYGEPVTLRLHAENEAGGGFWCAFTGTVPEKTQIITLESSVAQKLDTPATTEYVAHEAIPRGRASVIQPREGYVVVTEKVISSSGGGQLRQSFTTDTYPAQGTVIYHNPKDKPDVTMLKTEGPIEDYLGERSWDDLSDDMKQSMQATYTDEQLAMLFAPRRIVTLPDVTGLPEAEAVDKLKDAGIVARVSYQDSGRDGVAEGVCYEMDAKPGQRWNTDASLSLFVQRQKPHWLMPTDGRVSVRKWTDPIAWRFLADDVAVDLLNETYAPLKDGEPGVSYTSLDATLTIPGLTYGADGVTADGETLWDADALEGQEFYGDLSASPGQDYAAFSTYGTGDGGGRTLYYIDRTKGKGLRLEGYSFPCFVENALYAASQSEGGLWMIDPASGKATAVCEGWNITRINPNAAGGWVLFQGYLDGQRPGLYACNVRDGQVLQLKKPQRDSAGNEMEYTFLYGGVGDLALMRSEVGWLLFRDGKMMDYTVREGTLMGYIASDNGSLVLRTDDGITLEQPFEGTKTRYRFQPSK